MMSLLLAAVSATGAEAAHGMVASVHPLATDAGVRVLKEGGNAVDAAVAVALTLGVVDTDNSGIGGGCFMLIHRADGSLVAIDGREMAPAAATPDMFIREGKADTTLSQVGALASGVPGALAAYEFAVTHHGKRKLADLLLPAADLAEKGFPLNAGYARACLQEGGAPLLTEVAVDADGHEQFFAADDPAAGVQLGFISRTGHRVSVGTANVLTMFESLP